MTRATRHHRCSLLLVLVLGLLLGPAHALADADTLERGIAAYEAERYEQAYELLKPHAEDGDAEAQFRLARLYDNALGVEGNPDRALELFFDAANQGHAVAQRVIGYSYLEGIGVEQDDEKAFEWYRRAADSGNPGAQRSLGLRYKNGEGVEQDFAEAAQWFRRAAEQGDDGAFLELAIAYHHGQGVEQDYERAAYWSRRAMEAGYAHAQRLLAWQYVAGEGVDKDLARAKELYRDLLSEDDARDHYALGVLLQGEAEDSDDQALFREAYELFREAAAQGHARAMVNVGVHHSNGWGLERDNVESTAWFLLSYIHGYAEARRLIDHQLEYAWDADLEASRARARELARELGLELEGDDPLHLDG